MSVIHAVVLAAATLSLMCPSPVRSTASKPYANCWDCLESECHVKNLEPCTTDFYNDVVSFECLVDMTNPEHYTKEDCEKACDGTRACFCAGQCYVCAPKDTDTGKFVKCKIPFWMYDDKCEQIPYVPPDRVC